MTLRDELTALLSTMREGSAAYADETLGQTLLRYWLPLLDNILIKYPADGDKVLRDYAEAEDAAREAEKPPVINLQTINGIPVVASVDVPRDEVDFKIGNLVVGKIPNVADRPATEQAPAGDEAGLVDGIIAAAFKWLGLTRKPDKATQLYFRVEFLPIIRDHVAAQVKAATERIEQRVATGDKVLETAIAEIILDLREQLATAQALGASRTVEPVETLPKGNRLDLDASSPHPILKEFHAYMKAMRDDGFDASVNAIESEVEVLLLQLATAQAREKELRGALERKIEQVHNGQHHQWNDWSKCDHKECVEGRALLEASRGAGKPEGGR
jgi:hypothetical protein